MKCKCVSYLYPISAYIFFQSLCSNVNATVKKDLFFYKNQIEIGFNGTNFLDGYGFQIDINFLNRLKVLELSRPVKWFELFSYYSYKRFIAKRHYLNVTYQFGSFNAISGFSGIIGQVTGKYYKSISFGYGYVILDKKISLSFINQISYRLGAETVIIGYYSNPNWLEPVFGDVNYNSLGLSTGIDVNYPIYKQISLGVNIFYNHFFEYSKLNELARITYLYYTHAPNTDMINSNVKLCLRF